MPWDTVSKARRLKMSASLAQPSASRTRDLTPPSPSAEALGYFQPSASRTKSHASYPCETFCAKLARTIFCFALCPEPMSMESRGLAKVGVILVALHFIVSIAHGSAHLNLHIDLKTWQTVYVLVVITVLPLVSGFLLWRRRRGGFLLLLFSMLGSLIFGGYYHFIATGADNVASLGSHTWAAPFQVTAVLLAVTEAAGVLTGTAGALKR